MHCRSREMQTGVRPTLGEEGQLLSGDTCGEQPAVAGASCLRPSDALGEGGWRGQLIEGRPCKASACWPTNVQWPALRPSMQRCWPAVAPVTCRPRLDTFNERISAVLRACTRHCAGWRAPGIQGARLSALPRGAGQWWLVTSSWRGTLQGVRLLASQCVPCTAGWSIDGDL